MGHYYNLIDRNFATRVSFLDLEKGFEEKMG